MQDLNDKATGNTLTAAEWNEVPSEIQNIIEGLGITLSGADLNQLGKGIAGYVANGNFYTDSGAADAYVLTKIGAKQTLPEYTDGMIVEFLAGNDNTGASTINVAGLGVKNIVGTSNGGEIISGARIELRYRSGSGDFEIVNTSLTSGTVIPTTSGTSNDITGIPSWAKKITIMLEGVSTNGSSTPQIQLGDSGGIETTGYLSGGATVTSTAAAANSTTGLLTGTGGAAGDVRHGAFTLINISGNTWVLSGNLGYSSTGVVSIGGGAKTLTGVLDRIRLTTVNGTDTFDAGNMNIIYE